MQINGMLIEELGFEASKRVLSRMAIFNKYFLK